MLVLFARTWQGQPLGKRDYVISADEKPSIQARVRGHRTLAPASRGATRVEHEYGRGGVAESAVAAETAGWDGFAFTAHPVPEPRWLATGRHQSLDPLVAALSHVAAVTSRLRLLTYLVVVQYRNPFPLAKSAATADILSKGRLTLGVGTGYLKSEFFALGVDYDERNALFDEALECCRCTGTASRSPTTGGISTA